jgi:hypothetical protein
MTGGATGVTGAGASGVGETGTTGTSAFTDGVDAPEKQLSTNDFTTPSVSRVVMVAVGPPLTPKLTPLALASARQSGALAPIVNLTPADSSLSM